MIEKNTLTESRIRRKLDHFNSKYNGKIVMKCDIMLGSLFCENTDYNFCCIGVESVPCIGSNYDFMEKFSKSFYLNRYMDCFDILQTKQSGICTHCTFLKRKSFIPLVYEDFRLKKWG